MELGRGHSVTQSFDERTAGGMKFAGSSYNNTSSTIDGSRNSSTVSWCRDHDENRRGPHERDSAHHQLSSTLGQSLNRYSMSQGTHQHQQQQQQQQSQQHPQPHQQQLPPRPRNPGSQHYADVSVYYPRGNRNKPVKWSPEEDRKLREAVEKFSEARWKDIARMVETRNHVQCLQRWKKVLKPGLVKGQWSPEEDDQLVRLVERGFRNWGQVAAFMDGRTSKQCRERWCHHLDPAVRKGGYTAEEDDLIVFLQGEVGNRWADIAKRLTGRTENAVKIRWKALNRRQRDARNKAAAAAAAAAGPTAIAPKTRTGETSEEPQSTLSPRSGSEGETSAGGFAANRAPPPSSDCGPSPTAEVNGPKMSASTGSEGSARARWEQNHPTVFISKNDRGEYTAVETASTGAREASERGSFQGPVSTSEGRRMSAAPAESEAFHSSGSRAATVEARQELLSRQSRGLVAAARAPSTAAGSVEGKWPPRGPELGVRAESRSSSLDDTNFACSAGGATVEGSEGIRANRVPEAGRASTEEMSFRSPSGLRPSAERDGKEGGLHRLCAAMRNVEAMDKLQASGDDEVVDAAAAAAAERFRMRRIGTHSATRGESYIGATLFPERSALDRPVPQRSSAELLQSYCVPSPPVLPLAATDNNCRAAVVTALGPSGVTAAPPPRASPAASSSVSGGARNGKAPSFNDQVNADQSPDTAGEARVFSNSASVRGCDPSQEGVRVSESRNVSALPSSPSWRDSDEPPRSMVSDRVTASSCKHLRNGHHMAEGDTWEGERVGNRGRGGEGTTLPTPRKKMRRLSASQVPLPPQAPSSVTAGEAAAATVMSQPNASLKVELPRSVSSACARGPSSDDVGGMVSATGVEVVSSLPRSTSTTTTAA